MGLDIKKLREVKQEPRGRIIAQCPACAEEGMDRKCEHLIIYPDGKFGCALYPGHEGREHRKEIFRIAGIPDEGGKKLNVPKAIQIRRKR